MQIISLNCTIFHYFHTIDVKLNIWIRQGFFGTCFLKFFNFFLNIGLDSRHPNSKSRGGLQYIMPIYKFFIVNKFGDYIYNILINL